ncbi:MAG: PDZ domain-containing protein [candidate division Zixibacteria bacterium]|nr:PDZ domain-containing protein [candidate division Zixibacteria bacterium]
MFKKVGIIAVFSILSVLIILSATAQKSGDSLYSYSRLSTDIAFRISARYVDEVDSKELIYSGVRGMMDMLDPFSEFLERKDFDRLQEATKGKYSGLGMTIMLKDEIVTVVSPMEGTPAYRMGLRAGDKITEIDGESTQGMSTMDASNLMRGPAGTTVTISIEREGVDEPLEYTIERAVIELKTVPFYTTFERDGMKLGYVRLARFGEEADAELDEAFKAIANDNVEGVIFDLRSNGGGLLDQAVKVANYFLPKGSEVTSTKGRTADQDRTLYAQGEPLLDPSIPVVILVNTMSASASEIVAGSIQDWDRGIIIGNPTFGKGLVQQVYPLSDNTALKLTTAKWYVPSGRCIQKDSRSTRHPEDLEIVDGDESVSETEKEMFTTRGGRVVYGGGGVVPDIEIDEDRLNALEINLERLSMFFDFSVKYTTTNGDIKEDFVVTEEMIDEFRQFTKEKEFTYKSELEIDLEALKETIEDMDKTDDYAQHIENLENQIEADKVKQFDESIDYIKRSIKRDILTKQFGEKAVYRQNILKSDPYVEKAIEILTSRKEYTSILVPNG